MKEEITELIEGREKMYEEIKRKLLPIILKSIKEAEKIKGHMVYWDLYHKLKTFGLIRRDYERIISELEEKEIIEHSWAPNIGGYLKIRNY